jgi:F-type H+-transporting ATPase subunit gamma
MDTLESLRRKIDGAVELKSIVRTMKAMAASNIGQYEMAVESLVSYYQNVTLGMIAYFQNQAAHQSVQVQTFPKHESPRICAIIFGSDQGLVGQFNDTLAEYAGQKLSAMKGQKEIWAVGERIQYPIKDYGHDIHKLFAVPQTVSSITPLVVDLLSKIQAEQSVGIINEVYLFHNRPKSRVEHEPVMQRLLPFDAQWEYTYQQAVWVGKNRPEVIGSFKDTLISLIREFLFVSLFKASAESISSENASRLNAMQRAEKNIDELSDDLNQQFNSLRQRSIDEELFDVISGFETLRKKDQD